MTGPERPSRPAGTARDRLAFRLHVETRTPGGWQRVAEPVRSQSSWTRCGNCGVPIRGTRIGPAGYGGRSEGYRFAHVPGRTPTDPPHRDADATALPGCPGATPAVLRIPTPWHRPVVGAELAAILAGQPGGRHGFAPIGTARGMPADAAAEVRRAAADDPAGFGHSHLSVAELLAYDWQQCRTRMTFVADRDSRFPAGGRAAHTLMWATDHRLPSGVSDDADGPDAVPVEWPWPAWAAAGREFLVTVARLARIAATDLHGVRCVFWFAETDDGR